MKTWIIEYQNESGMHKETAQVVDYTAAYLDFVYRHPPTDILVNLYEKSSCSSSLEEEKKLFESNMSLVGYVYQRRFSSFENHHEDLMQEGYLALWKACLNFDPSRNIQFSTYAVPAIERRMRDYIQKFVMKHKLLISLDDVVSEDGEGRELHLYDILSLEEYSTAKQLINDALVQMKPKEQRVIRKLMEGYLQDQVSEELGISQSSISKYLTKFRKIISKEKELWQY